MAIDLSIIIIKQLAHNLRQIYPELKIEGHPHQNGPRRYPKLIITDHERQFFLEFEILGLVQDLLKMRLRPRNRKKSELVRCQKVELSNPSSIDQIENWIIDSINNSLRQCQTNET